MADWKTLSTETIYQNKWLRLDEDTVINPIGQQSIYSHFELNSEFVSVVAIDDDDSIYLTQQYRYPIQSLSWEIVSGQTDGQTVIQAAARELMEETGLHATSFEEVGGIYVDAGLSGSKGKVIIARGLSQATDELDQLDGITQAKPFPIAEIRRMIKDGEIQTPHTIAAFYIALEHMEK